MIQDERKLTEHLHPRNALLKAIRTQTSLPDSIREVAISRVVALNETWFEWKAHAPLLLKSSDVSISQPAVDYILNSPLNSHKIGASGPGGLEEKHMAVIAFTDASTKDIKVPQNVFDELKKSFDEKEIIEITATVAAYNCVTRFLVALHVGDEKLYDGKPNL
jgi:alkylhydroperoxidase family enzyme